MDYGQMIAARREAWRGARQTLDRRTLVGLDFDAVEGLVALHRQLSAELGVVQARWPGTEAESTLRHLVLKGHRLIAPPQPGTLARLRDFLLYEYPEAFRASAPAVRLSVGVFLAGFWLGLVLCTWKDGFALLVIGQEHLDLLRGGQIWTDDLGDQSPMFLAVQIFVNNIKVALYAWAGGVLLGLGTTYVLLYNGVMVGCLVAVCARYGLLDRLFAFIPAHGMLELFLITVAGAAGYELTLGVLGEGEGTFGRRFGAGAIRSMRLVGGTVPWLVLLGIVEGFFSPGMGFPTGFKVIVGLCLLAVFLLYTRLPRRSP